MSLILPNEVTLGNDHRYKSFVAAIEKILKQFENSTEWADLIANLVKVKKVSLTVTPCLKHSTGKRRHS